MKKANKIPIFKNEEEERAFWSKNDSWDRFRRLQGRCVDQNSLLGECFVRGVVTLFR